MEYEIINFREEYLDDYQAFARSIWGKYCYQSRSNYIDWLHKENPLGHKPSYFLLGLDSRGSVIACTHKMRFPWLVRDKETALPASHNLAVRPEYRKGMGAFLILAGYKKENHALLIGSTGKLASAYRKLRFQPIITAWYRKVISPLRGGVRLALNRLSGERDAEDRLAGLVARLKSKGFLLGDGVEYATLPTEDLISGMLQTLNDLPMVEARPIWNPELIRWRFFHPIGPRHLLVYRDAKAGMLDFLVISYGIKKGLTVARIIEPGLTSPGALRTLLINAIRLLKAMGVHVLMAYSGDRGTIAAFSAAGWKPFQGAPESFFFHKDKKDIFQTYSLNGSVGDYGFESIVGTRGANG